MPFVDEESMHGVGDREWHEGKFATTPQDLLDRLHTLRSSGRIMDIDKVDSGYPDFHYLPAYASLRADPGSLIEEGVAIRSRDTTGSSYTAIIPLTEEPDSKLAVVLGSPPTPPSHPNASLTYITVDHRDLKALLDYHHLDGGSGLFGRLHKIIASPLYVSSDVHGSTNHLVKVEKVQLFRTPSNQRLAQQIMAEIASQ